MGLRDVPSLHLAASQGDVYPSGHLTGCQVWTSCSLTFSCFLLMAVSEGRYPSTWIVRNGR